MPAFAPPGACRGLKNAAKLGRSPHWTMGLHLALTHTLFALLDPPMPPPYPPRAPTPRCLPLLHPHTLSALTTTQTHPHLPLLSYTLARTYTHHPHSESGCVIRVQSGASPRQRSARPAHTAASSLFRPGRAGPGRARPGIERLAPGPTHVN